MVTKTRKTPKSQENQNGEAIAQSAKIKLEQMDRGFAVAESDLTRAQEELMNTFGVDNIEAAFALVKEMNTRLPGLQKQRDEQVAKIQEFLNQIN